MMVQGLTWTPGFGEGTEFNDKFSGAGMLDTIMGLKKAVDDNDKAAIAAYSVGLAFDVVGAALNPLGAVIGAGVGWLIDHIAFLREPLDLLVGDNIAIRQETEKVKEDAKQYEGIATAHLDALKKLDGWIGQTADNFRASMAQVAKEMEAIGSSIHSSAKLMATMGACVTAVRSLVRDIIAMVIGNLIGGALIAAGLAPITFGASIVAFVGVAVATAVQAVSRIMNHVTKLKSVMSSSAKSADDLGEALVKLSDDAGRFGKGGGSADVPAPPPVKGPTTDAPTPTGGSGSGPKPPSGDAPPVQKPPEVNGGGGGAGGGKPPAGDTPPVQKPPEVDTPPATKPPETGGGNTGTAGAKPPEVPPVKDVPAPTPPPVTKPPTDVPTPAGAQWWCRRHAEAAAGGGGGAVVACRRLRRWTRRRLRRWTRRRLRRWTRAAASEVDTPPPKVDIPAPPKADVPPPRRAQARRRGAKPVPKPDDAAPKPPGADTGAPSLLARTRPAARWRHAEARRRGPKPPVPTRCAQASGTDAPGGPGGATPKPDDAAPKPLGRTRRFRHAEAGRRAQAARLGCPGNAQTGRRGPEAARFGRAGSARHRWLEAAVLLGRGQEPRRRPQQVRQGAPGERAHHQVRQDPRGSSRHQPVDQELRGARRTGWPLHGGRQGVRLGHRAAHGPRALEGARRGPALAEGGRRLPR
ncbi:hypothetical protein [Lentzea guizhouensis]|uniref:hypothetical protein n=1 Tax=Lentzea guizhouensis TaxID=1586287 RepID=UPI000B1809BC|nr:hypothetical protein [Lentzea guizhouensis]